MLKEDRVVDRVKLGRSREMVENPDDMALAKELSSIKKGFLDLPAEPTLKEPVNRLKDLESGDAMSKFGVAALIAAPSSPFLMVLTNMALGGSVGAGDFFGSVLLSVPIFIGVGVYESISKRSFSFWLERRIFRKKYRNLEQKEESERRNALANYAKETKQFKRAQRKLQKRYLAVKSQLSNDKVELVFSGGDFRLLEKSKPTNIQPLLKIVQQARQLQEQPLAIES